MGSVVRSWSRVGDVAGDLDRKQRVPAEGVADLLGLHLEDRPVLGAAGGDQDMVDRRRQALAEAGQRTRIVGVKGRGTVGVDLERGLLQAVEIAAGEDHVGRLGDHGVRA